MSVRHTSKESHSNFKLTGKQKECKEKMIKFMKKKKVFTRRMISEYTKISTATVAGIIRPMLDEKQPVIKEMKSKGRCMVTGNRVTWIVWGGK